MKLLLTIPILMVYAVAAQATTTINYEWEDGGTVLNIYPDPDLPSLLATNVSADGGNHVYADTYSLRLEHNEPGGTSVAYLAYLWNLQDGNLISAGFHRYDDTPGAFPLVRIAAHWNDELPVNPDGHDGIAGGNEDYGLGLGWDQTSWEWTVYGGHCGLVIEAVVNGNVGDVVWIDELYIELPGPESMAYIQIPGESPVATESRTWGAVKALYR